jgi:hypothetical protein
MKRTIITAGVLGLAAFAVAAPATAADKIVICHASGGGIYEGVDVSVSALAGHDLHAEDIIPPNNGIGARNWDSVGIGIHTNGCVVPAVVVDPPADDDPPVVVDNPVDEEQPVVVQHPVEQQPVVETPVLAPAAEQPAAIPPAAAPAAPRPAAVQPQARPASGAPAAAAPVTRGTNQGYNAQTAVGSPESSPAWFGGLGALVAAGAAVALRRRSGSSTAG